MMCGILLAICMIGSGCGSRNGDSSGQESASHASVDDTPESAALDTIALINHINYVVEVIRTYNNVVALENEYQAITADNLNLNRIPDETILQDVQNILNTLHGMRMDERQRKWYRHTLANNLSEARLKGTAEVANKVTEAFVNGKGFVSRLASTAAATAVGTVKAYSDYKLTEHQLRTQWEGQQYDLDSKKLEDLHKLTVSLLERQWGALNKYKLDDRLRIASREIQSLAECLKDTDPKRCFQRLKPMAHAFEVYPTYWHYRAAMALASGDNKDAISSCDHFEKINRGLFRSDEMAANVAMYKVTAMLQLDRIDKKAVRRCLDEICRQNYNQSNAAQALFCANVYFSVLDDTDKALETLDALESRLVAEKESELVSYRDLFTRPEKTQEEAPNTVDLTQCHMLRLAIEKQTKDEPDIARLKEICGQETTGSLEKLYYFGALRIEDLWNAAKEDIVKINLGVIDGEMVLQLPVSWFLLGNLDATVELLEGNTVLQSLQCEDSSREFVVNSVWMEPNAPDMAYVSSTLPVTRAALEKADGVRLKINHVSWPVEVRYMSSVPLSSGNPALTPVKVERFMGKAMDREIMRNPKEAAAEDWENLVASAEHGDADAQCELGMRWFGDGSSEEDNAKAAEWFLKAARQGNAGAQTWLGMLYANGWGVKQNNTVAMDWFRQAAEQGHRAAQYRLSAMDANAKRWGFICDAFRRSGIELGGAFCLANSHTAEEWHPKRHQAVQDVNELEDVWVYEDEVIFWNVPAGSNRSSLLVTAKDIFYLKGDKISRWDWEDIRQIDWEREAGGNVIINGTKCKVVVDYRKPFVDTVKRIVEHVRQE